MIPTLSAPVAAPRQITPQSAGIAAPDQKRIAFEKDTPTGPPPSFDESFLARQAREALKPPEISRKAQGETDVLPQTKADTRAETGFAEIRALAAAPAKALMDKRA